MKIGRNELCPCQSGKKYKQCCGNISKRTSIPTEGNVPPEVMQHAQDMMRRHQAEENVRQQQQGYGRPIISWTDTGYRFVAVGKTITWSKNWLVFPDFLLNFMKATLGPEWGEQNKNKGKHPIFRWLEKYQRYSASLPTEGKLKSGSMKGFLACWLHLAYGLYLIAHNDEIPPPLIKRLQNPVTFMPAYYETLVGAVLAVAGFELSCAEKETTSDPTPEFRAKSKVTGTIYEVEAKRKDGWKAATEDVGGTDFQKELRGYVRNQIYAASKKNLKNPIYWFELSIPTIRTEKDWRIVAAKVEETIREAEKDMTVDGQSIQSAFIAITNHTSLANEDAEGDPSFGFLETIKIDDYPFGRSIELEAALEGYDKYRDIFDMMEALKVARAIPVTFDGTPPELLSTDGVSKPTMKIGDLIEVQDANGKPIKGKITEIASMNDSAMVSLTANGRNWLQWVPLSDAEAKAARRFTDAVFGKHNASRQSNDDDPIRLYNFFLRSQATMSQEQINKFFSDHPALSHYKDLPLQEARVRIAREFTKWLWIRRQQERSMKEQPD